MAGSRSHVGQQFARRVSDYIGARLGIDSRSLAAFRILLGCALIADILMRSRHLAYFYTSDGVVTARDTLDGELVFSLFHLSDDPGFAVLFFVLYFVVAVTFLVGWNTRIATVLLFLFAVSLHHRNPYVLNYGDTLLRLLLLWGIFLPLGERWSVDAVRSAESPRPTITCLAGGLILLQMVFVHFGNGYEKATEGVWFNDPAIAYILGRDHTTVFLGNILREFPTLLHAGSLLWMFMLVSAWALLVLTGRERTVFVLLFVGFHVSMLVTRPMSVGPLVAIAGLVLLLQDSFWQDLSSLGSTLGVDRLSSGVERERATAVLRAIPAVPVTADGLGPLRRGLYVGSLATVILLVLFAPAVGWIAGLSAVADTFDDRSDGIEDAANSLSYAGSVFDVEQPRWSMHSRPSPVDRYYVVAAETIDGEFLDVYNERALDFQRPSATLSGQFDSHRHRKHMSELRSDEEGYLRERMGEYLCQRWQSDHEPELLYINMYEVQESFDLETVNEPEERDRWFHHTYTHSCSGEKPQLIEPEDDGEAFTRTETETAD